MTKVLHKDLRIDNYGYTRTVCGGHYTTKVTHIPTGVVAIAETQREAMDILVKRLGGI